MILPRMGWAAEKERLTEPLRRGRAGLHPGALVTAPEQLAMTESRLRAKAQPCAASPLI